MASSTKDSDEMDDFVKSLFAKRNIKNADDLKTSMISCQDDVGGDVYKKDLYSLLTEIGIDLDGYLKCDLGEIKEEKLTINGKNCSIKFIRGHYCGYVLDEIGNDYTPHGGFTALNGFDCMHYNDLSLNPLMFSFERDYATFKTRMFVYNELVRLTDDD